MKNLPLSYIEISKSNLLHNVKQFRSSIKKGTKLSVAIKGNAYGHGQNEVAQILETHVDYLQVNSIGELQVLRRVSDKRCFLFGYVEKLDLPQAIKLGCILSVFSLEQLEELNTQAGKLKCIQEIHIPFDAYLGREGFLLDQLPEVCKAIKKCRNIQFSGIYAHFANVEDTPDFTHAQKQIDEYKRALDLALTFGFKDLDTHMSASSGILAYEKGKGINSIVRLGLSVYGMWPSEYLESLYKNQSLHLLPVLSWKTKIVQVKTLPKGRTIGYGLTYTTRKETKIAIIPQGYADGIDRGFSNNGEVLIGSTRCSILGRIHMNMIAVDVTHLKKIKQEDEVVILGQQGKENITAEEMAERIDTINYEITTRISPLLPRVVK